MLFSRLSKSSENEGSFNVTPLIDIVFLLIIFFMVVCQFITAENFEVAVPDDISQVESPQEEVKYLTVTVMKDADGTGRFAVGSLIIDSADRSQIAGRITEIINQRLSSKEPGERVVCLRIDEQIEFSDYKHVWSAVSRSIATDVQLAGIREDIGR